MLRIFTQVCVEIFIYGGDLDRISPSRIRVYPKGFCVRALIVFLYVVVCFLLIFAVLLQNNKGAQMSAGFSGHPSKSFFGSAGAKSFLYTSTKWLIVFFFSLAFIQTGLDYKEHHRIESFFSLVPRDPLNPAKAP